MTKIAHEAEVQRQHPRYRIPIRCIYNGTQISVVDVSVGGIGLRAGSFEVKPGRVLDLTLVFPFSGYELTLPINAEVRYIAEEHSRIGLRFVDVSPRQHNLLRFILDAILPVMLWMLATSWMWPRAVMRGKPVKFPSVLSLRDFLLN